MTAMSTKYSIRKAKAHVLPMRCVRCGETKPGALFTNDATRPGGKFPWCKECVMTTRRARPRVFAGNGDGTKKCRICERDIGGTHANRAYCSETCKGRAAKLRVFGLEPDEYRQVIALMDGRCPICGRGVKKWQMDHDHKTGETMGPVCVNCNVHLLAFSGHDPTVGDRLASFLRDPPVRTLFGERRYVGPEQMPQLDRMWGWTGVPADAVKP